MVPPDEVDAFFAAIGATPPPRAEPRLAAELDDRTYLQGVAERLRLARARRGMSRRLLAQQSGVSERYIAQVEGGTGNVSILLLRAVTRAMGLTPVDILAERSETPLDALLARLTPRQLHEAHVALARQFSVHTVAGRDGRIALIGLRGAGKSSLGKLLAEARGVPFLELDRAIEQAAGVPLREIFELHGQTGFRRLERDVLESLLRDAAPAVIAAGGGIVSTPATYNMLLRSCRTVWLRASPEEHMRRVLDQGDLRPMRETPTAMDDLRAILASREPLYARADVSLDTSNHTLGESFAELLRLLG